MISAQSLSGTHLHIYSMGVIHSRSWRQDLENERNRSETVIIRTHIGRGPTGSQASGQVKRFPALSCVLFTLHFTGSRFPFESLWLL